MKRLNPKPEKPKRSDEETILMYSVQLPVIARAVAGVVGDLRRVVGILEGAATASTVDDIRHRVRTIAGHMKGVGQAIEVLQLLRSTVSMIAEDIG